MRCKNCGNETFNDDIFCSSCKKKMKASSSREEVAELTSLIEENQKMNELEITKELVNLDNLIEENFVENQSLNDKVEPEEEKTETLSISEPSPLEDNTVKPIKNKKLIIISIIILILALITVIVLLLVKKGNKDKEDINTVVDYEEILTKYGDNAVKSLEKHMKDSDDLPTWQELSSLIAYDDYEVLCSVHDIYTDKSIYLNNCKIDGKSIKYSYGKKQEVAKEGKKIDIFSITIDGNNYYSDIKEKNYNLIATITCKEEECSYIYAVDKYVLIKENNQYYIYNYLSDAIEFGPFNMESDYDYYKHLIIYNQILYGISYEDNSFNYLYNINNSKTFKNIKGSLLINEVNNNQFIMAKYGYVIYLNSGAFNFVNLNTGNVSYTIKESTINDFYEDIENKIVYIICPNSNYTKFNIYNSNGKRLFEEDAIKDFKMLDDNRIIISNGTSFKVYTSNIKLEVTSKKYDKVLGLYNDFVVVIDNKHLKAVDLNDKEIVTFDLEWDDTKYSFHKTLSGVFTKNNKNGIYLIIENKKVEYGTIGSGLEYYYIFDTKESGFLETDGVG